MRENTVTGVTSGRHMGMYRALSTEFNDDVTSKQQNSILTGVVSIMNLCGQSGIIIPRFCRARDIMLQKKHNNFSISVGYEHHHGNRHLQASPDWIRTSGDRL